MSAAKLLNNFRMVEGAGIRREGQFEPSTVNREERTIDLVWTTGSRVLRADWLGDQLYYEELSVDPSHIRLVRLSSGASPMLDSHLADSLDDQIGSVVRVWFADGKGWATVKFRKNKKSLEIFEDVAEGTVRNVSIGYQVHEFEESTEQDAVYPTLRAVDYEVFEVSIVPIGADPGAQFRNNTETIVPIKIRSISGMAAKKIEQTKTQAQHVSEPIEERSQKSSANAQDNAIDLAEIRKEAILKERQRSNTIRDLCLRGGLDEGFAAELIENDIDLSVARERILDAIVARDQPEVKTVRLEMVRDETETKRSAMINALEHRVDSSIKLIEPARNYRGMSLLDMARHCLEVRGERFLFGDKMKIVERAMNSSSDFPEILSNVANKIVLSSYEKALQRQTFTPLVRITEAPDFKEIERVRLGETPSFKQIPEGAEVTAGYFGEAKEAYKIATYGRKIPITRQAIINDSLGAFDSMGNWGAAAARLESDLVWSVFIDNPNMGDGVPLFHADHNNVASGQGGKMSIKTFSDAEYAMSIQKGIDERDHLAIEPSYLIVPSRLKTEAYQIMSQRYVPNSQNEVNPFEGQFKVISETRLNKLIPKNNSAMPWFLAAHADNVIDLIEMAYLNGERTPYTSSQVNFDTDALEIKARIDVGVKALDYRGFYKNPGSRAA